MARHITLRASRTRLGAILLGLTTAVLVAACGSSATSHTTTQAASTATSAAAATTSKAATRGVAIATAHGANATYLTGASGRAVYLWVADAKNMSSCAGACAQAWPPVTASGGTVATDGVNTADLGTIVRSDGTKQVTYDGHPLYYFAGDPKAGSITGQGSDSFGAKWWLVSPAGAAIMTGTSGSGATPAASSTAGSGGATSSWS
jgi:predicted lipoprotein with Yx(FWY)xxD motif